jgi:AraC-like DNA-binding protein
MEQLYRILDAFFAPGILLGIAVCLFFLAIPPKPALRNYRVARYVMGAAYLFYALCIYLEYHVLGMGGDELSRPIILSIASVQAFLFTFTLITLIHLNFVTSGRLLLELVPIVVMSVALFVPNLYGSELAQWAFWLFVLIYVGLLARYVILFRREYRRYEMQMDNYFSDEDARRLHWVKRSFYIALTIGVLALVYALMPVAPVASVFMAVVIVFYTAFGVRFINYALHFPAIETAITADDDVELSDPQADDLVMMKRIDDLMNQEKLYRRLDLSVGDIAERLDEKPRVVSSVIRACRQMNFKTYINEFRVQEAKRLFDEDKENTRTIEAISVEAGFANRSSFYRVFKSSQGISPTDYRLATK